MFWEQGPSGKVIDAWRDGLFELVVSEEIIREITRVLENFKIRLPESDLLALKREVRFHSFFVNPEISVDAVSDPDDNKFLEAAVAANASYVVSQDKQVLKVGSYEGIVVMAPHTFLEKIYSLSHHHCF